MHGVFMICEIHKKEMIELSGEQVCSGCLASASMPAINAMSKLIEHQDQKSLEVRLNAIGIPARFLDATFDNFHPSSDRAARLRSLLMAYVDEFELQRSLRSGFIFIGMHGRGKTHLACAIAKGLMSKFMVRYVNLPDLTLRIKSTYSNNPPEKLKDIVADLVGCDFLILDEIDLHGASDFDYQVLYEIINGRYDATNRPTLAISNRDIDRLTADLDGRIVSRLLSGTPPIIFDWESERDKQAAVARKIILEKQMASDQ